MRSTLIAIAAVAAGATALVAQQGAAPQGRAGGPGTGQDLSGADFSPKPPIQARTAAEQAKSFVTPPGFRMELVASDPDIQNPAVIEWDGDGRMYVSEFRSYMIDADATREHEPLNRISRWESTRGDGVYDKHTVFVDNIMFARGIVAIDKNCILINETHSDDMLKLCDTNNDGVADTRDVFYSGVGLGRDGNVEHEQANFMWALDNWIYSTYNAFRFRWTPNGILREPTATNGASWGLTQDTDGKPWFINAGGERGPVNYQFPIQYGNLTLDEGFEPEFATVYPAPGIGDIQGGMRRTRVPANNLNHFTAAAGAAVVRSDRLPADMLGDLLFAEPVGRLIRRARIVKNEGLTQLRNVYPGSEFVLGTDPLFRPVNIKIGPDGAAYIADMYHGIIQEAQWSNPGSYLRSKIEQYQLDKIIGHGRIWRLRFDGVAGAAATSASPARAGVPAIPLDPTQPKLLQQTATQLVATLSHPNGWWRDMAQRLLVLKQDKSVVPALQSVARAAAEGETAMAARFHALWTLEGLGALDAALVRQTMEDKAPRMRVQGIRVSETLYKAGDKSFAADYKRLAGDPDVDVAIQSLLTMNLLKTADAAAVIKATMDANRSKGVQEIAKFLTTPAAVAAPAAALSPEDQKLFDRGQGVYGELCAECHGADGRGTPLAGAPAGTTMAPPLAGSPRVQGHRDYVVKALLHGLTGPIDGKTYTQVMIPMGAQQDDWIASVGSYIRTSFGNNATFIAPADVARVRAATTARKTQWTAQEIQGSLPVLLQSQSTWKVTASHNPAAASAALTLAGWNSAEGQKPGMYLQIELPEVVTLAEVQFTAAGGGRLGGGGPSTSAQFQAGTTSTPGTTSTQGTTSTAGTTSTPGTTSTAPGRGRGTVPPGPVVLGIPRQYQVQVSLDGQRWTPVASGTGAALTTASFAPARARLIRITQTATVADAPPWVVQNLRLYSAAGR